MEMEQISETSVFNSAMKWLIAGEDCGGGGLPAMWVNMIIITVTL
jgi:hypothetical protein